MNALIEYSYKDDDNQLVSEKSTGKITSVRQFFDASGSDTDFPSLGITVKPDNKMVKRLGVMCKCKITVEKLREVITVPYSAIEGTGEYSRVSVLQGQKKIVRYVEIGYVDYENDIAEILTGVCEDEKIILPD